MTDFAMSETIEEQVSTDGSVKSRSENSKTDLEVNTTGKTKKDEASKEKQKKAKRKGNTSESETDDQKLKSSMKRKTEQSAKQKDKKTLQSEMSSKESLSGSGGKKSKIESDPANNGDLVEAVKKARLKAGSSVEDFKYNKQRVHLISENDDLKNGAQGIIYWMSRDQRVQDNWALLYAQRLALKQKWPLHVCFCLVPKFLDATIRHFGFMLKGLQEVAEECKDLNIPFHLLIGYAKNKLPQFIKDHNIGGMVTDFSPLRVPLQWVQDVKENLPKDVPFVQVDAHNLVPCWIASDKLEYGARTIRRKIHDKLPQFLTEFPPVICHPYTANFKEQPIDWGAAYESLEVDRSVTEVEWAKPGTLAGLRMLESFIEERLKYFHTDRNNPNRTALSNLSPWFHFGQVAVQRAILEIRKHRKFRESVDGFIEEAVVRRELADNFCFFNKKYDSLEGAYEWAKTTLKIHATDKRSHVYTLKQLEEGKTHDPLWNAAQLQMVREGKMHGFLRMYWAKKILEWTRSPEEALEWSIYLNDRYELDGRDPNGYVGCMWSICGIHDQGWAERPVFGKIRYMNYEGCKRKFDVTQFERKYSPKNLCP
ncbi:deoxyribodipyrimidine photo-lyase-like [Protopterus annectens]|uniref:deoxyribodipyrimidine photo-lyase-like n=1 Tax=Protopterus annectens TaxID=7888 RepID=UPI001CFB9170|nr:deoxyribodipyrimidine photo-lyase-like [Protopterus annectens]